MTPREQTPNETRNAQLYGGRHRSAGGPLPVGRAVLAMMLPGAALALPALLLAQIGLTPTKAFSPPVAASSSSSSSSPGAARSATPGVQGARGGGSAEEISLGGSDAPSPAEAGPTLSAVRRDGGFWVQTVSGGEPVSPATRVRVSTVGSVDVKGDDSRDVRFELVKRVRAGSEQAARRALEQFTVRMTREGEAIVLRVVHPGGAGHEAELSLTGPRATRDAEIQTHGGPIQAQNLGGALRARTGGGPMTLDRIDGGVSVHTAGGPIVLGAVGGPIRCTTSGGAISARMLGGDAVLETAGGDIDVAEARGGLRAITAGGGIRVRASAGPVTASTAGGSIDIGRVRGRVTASNFGGPIEIAYAEGVSVDSASGAIRLGEVAGAVRATTSAGDIVARLVRFSQTGDSLLATGGGDITVLIPAGTPLTIRAENTSRGRLRRIVSEIPGVQVRNEGALAIAEGRLAGGGPLLRLANTSGTIYIKQDTAGGAR